MLDRSEATILCAASGAELRLLSELAHRLCRKRFGDTVSFCAILNAKSGRCGENCAFCAQSAHHAAASPVHALLPLGEVRAAAKAARERGVHRFGIVTSGARLSSEDFESLLAMVAALTADGSEPDASVGLVSAEQLARLKDAGLSRLHHNLETSAAFFPRICTTHAYEEDVAVVRAALAAGLAVCSGGLFGLGESWEDRVELALTLRELGVDSVPMNFLHPIPGTPLAGRTPLSREEALHIIALYRFLLPRAHLRVCGGRALVFGQDTAAVLTSGASGLMVGDYLTTRGGLVAHDAAVAAGLGLTVTHD